MNLFEEAIKKGELLQFATGKDKYFILDREYGEHWIHGSWVNYILPLINERGEEIINPQILNLFKSILGSESLDIEKKGDILLYHLHIYYYQKHEGKIQSDALTIINTELQHFLDSYMDYLVITKSSKIGAVQNAIDIIKSRGGLLPPPDKLKGSRQ